MMKIKATMRRMKFKLSTGCPVHQKTNPRLAKHLLKCAVALVLFFMSE